MCIPIISFFLSKHFVNLFFSWLQAKKALATVRSTRQRYMRLTLVRPGEFPEMKFRNYLVEDKRIDGGCSSYVELLCNLHNEIRAVLNDEVEVNAKGKTKKNTKLS